jgi:hypothetical protein
MARHSEVTIVDPRIRTSRDMTGTIRDYISVPWISTIGSWPISYMLSDEQMVHLAVLANYIKPIAKARPKHN